LCCGFEIKQGAAPAWSTAGTSRAIARWVCGFADFQESAMASTDTAGRVQAAPATSFPNSTGRARGSTLPLRSVARCAFCGEPLPFTETGINAWRAGNQFFCNEFCADSASD
jgi:hypothetical protein